MKLTKSYILGLELECHKESEEDEGGAPPLQVEHIHEDCPLVVGYSTGHKPPVAAFI